MGVANETRLAAGGGKFKVEDAHAGHTLAIVGATVAGTGDDRMTVGGAVAEVDHDVGHGRVAVGFAVTGRVDPEQQIPWAEFAKLKRFRSRPVAGAKGAGPPRPGIHFIRLTRGGGMPPGLENMVNEAGAVRSAGVRVGAAGLVAEISLRERKRVAKEVLCARRKFLEAGKLLRF